ncbi:MAG: ATP-dependent nuclease [Candidatus Rifleibacteriota bacterium]
MKIIKIELFNVKSFDKKVLVEFDKKTSVFSISGQNGSGKSTFLRSAYLVQKAYFLKLLSDFNWSEFEVEANRYLNDEGSYIKVLIVDGEDGHEEKIELELYRTDDRINLRVENGNILEKYWNLKSPQNLILFIDASKGFSEDTLLFDEINISENARSDLALEAVFRPERLFSGIYRQLVKDYVHGRLIPSKPDRLLYFRVASKMFTTLIPNIELKNFSGKHKFGEFVLLGKANVDKRKPLYDVREFSSGEKALLSTLSFLCISKSVCALFIDEPENHFHESLLLEFVSLLYTLCESGGILGWANRNHDGRGKASIKEEWLEQEYQGHRLNQVVLSTHSKTLIYKLFSMGRNFTISRDVNELRYENAENELRELGLSSIYNKVLLVEGSGDHEALEYLAKGKNITIKPLGGSSDVIDTFKKLSVLREFVRDQEFVFVVDSDNKPDDFFVKLRSMDEDFYDGSFVKLDRHEFENYLLDASVFADVIDKYLELGGQEKEVGKEDVHASMVDLAKKSLPQVYKKELSLMLGHRLDGFFSEKIWGNKSFLWETTDDIERQIKEDVFSDSAVDDLINDLFSSVSDVFDVYENADDNTLLKRCDGKQVLGRACAYFSNIAGVDNKVFRKAIYRESFRRVDSLAYQLVDQIFSKFSYN